MHILPLPQGQGAFREIFLFDMVFSSSDPLPLCMVKRTLIEDIVVQRPNGERHEPDQERQPNRSYLWRCCNKEKDRLPKTTETACYFLPHRPHQAWPVGQWQAEPLIRSTPFSSILIQPGTEVQPKHFFLQVYIDPPAQRR